jgi:hypothetical protein
MTQPPSSDPSATQPEPGASEEPAILTLPVELQKTIVEYVSIGYLVSWSTFNVRNAGPAAERPARTMES